MKQIKTEYITIAFLCLLAFSLCFVLGFIYYFLFIPAALSLIGYIVIDRKFLRCPNCGGFINLDRLHYAKSHNYHCMYCGTKIAIEK